MPTSTQLPRNLRPLNHGTEPGVFVADGGIRFWIFDGAGGRFAVQLDESPDRPAFSYHELDDAPVGVGIWLGRAIPKAAAAVERSFIGRAGLLISSGIRSYLKVCNPGGGSSRLMIYPYDSGDAKRYSTFYPHWSLYTELNGERLCIFTSAEEPPRLASYDFDPCMPPSCPQLTLVKTD